MKKILLSLLVFAFSLKGFGQNYKAIPLEISSKEFRDIDLKGDVSKRLSKNFLSYSLFTLDTKNLKSFARKNKKGKIQFDLSLPNLSSINISIVENDILSADYKLVVATDKGREVFEKKECITYSGSITDQLENTIRLTLTDDVIHGEIKINDKDYFIEPLQYIVDSKPNTIFVLYEKKDVIEDPLNTCGAIEVEKEIQKTATNTNRPGYNCYRVRMAIATDFSAYTALGGTVNNASTHSIAIMNLSAPYFSNSQFNTNVDLVLVGQYISTSLATDPYTCSGCTLTTGIDINTQLPNFGTWAKNGNFGFSFDLAHNITNRYNSGTIGLAYVGTIGMTQYNTGVSSMSSSPTWLTFIHEVGHNFGLSHTFQLGQGTTGGFMDYGDGTINGAYGWNLTYSSTEYENEVYRAANAVPSVWQTRLSSCNVIGATVTDFISNKDIQCIGSSVQFRDNSLGGPTSWSWTFQDGTPASSTDTNPLVSFSTSGIKSVTLTTNNGNGATTKTKYIYVPSSITTAACVNSGVMASTIANDLGPTKFILNTINKSSGGSRTDGNKYFDYMCSDNTVLAANSTYNVTISNNYASVKFQFFIDYNDDGDFLDANETIYNGDSSSTSGSVTFSFTTPSSLPKLNKLLRARILSVPSSFLTTVNSCYNPGEFGQVEDYGIVFECSSTVVPTFTPIATICNGGTITLPTTSTNSISGTWSPAINNTATTTYTFTPTSGLCASTTTLTVGVNQIKTATLSSTVGTNSQTKCISTAITAITYTTTGATGATFSGLPSGVTGNWTANIVTISGTPSVAGTYNYTITLTGGCGTGTATGSIIVNAIATATSGGPNTVCKSSSPVAFALTGASIGGSATTGAWSIISGGGTLSSTTQTATPASVTYTPAVNYSGTVTLRLTSNFGTSCSAAIADRVVNVLAAPTATAGEPNTVCLSASPIAFALVGASVGGSATTGAWSIVSGGGTLSSTAQTATPASITYTPPANFTGTVTLRLTSNTGTGCTSVSADRIVTVTSSLTASVSITSDAVNNIICSGSTVIFTASPTNGGAIPSFQWKLNGANVGTNSTIYTIPSLANGDVVTVVMTPDAAFCSTNSSATAIPITTSVTPTTYPIVTIESSSTNGTPYCAGSDITFHAITNNAENPTFQWKVNGNFVQGDNDYLYTYSLANGYNVSVEMTVTNTCVLSSVVSDNMTVEIKEVGFADVMIMGSVAEGDLICSSAYASFTAYPYNGGDNPTFKWKLNGEIVGDNSNFYANTTWNNNDALTVEMTSNAVCLSNPIVTSPLITISVNPSLFAEVSISSNADNNTICAGTSVIFTANPTNGGLSPSYQWKLNGIDVGTNSNTYTNPSLSNGDIVTVEMTSNATPCLAGSPALAIGITTTVNNCNQTRSAVLSLQAGDETICNGNLAHLIITATGTGPFSGMINGTIPFEGNTSPIEWLVEPWETTTFTITEISDASGPIDASQISGQVQVIVNDCNQTRSAVLSLLAGDEAICNGNLAHLIVYATGTGLFSGMINGTIPFESYESPINVPVEPGETTTFTITEISDASGPIDASHISGQVQVIVNDCNQTISAVLSLQVGDETICNGDIAHLSIAVTGTGPWFGTLSDGTGFSGSDNPLLVTVTPTTNATYTIATLSSETATASTENLSGSATITVNQPTIERTVATSCGMYIWETGNRSDYMTSGTYSYTENCVEHILELTVNQPTIERTVATSCGMYIWENGNHSDYFETGTYSYTENCVEHILELTVNQPTIERTVATSCGMYIWETGNHSDYFETGTYSYTENCVEHILDLTINSNTITSQPINATICKVIGGTASLSVATSGATATYKWYTQALATATTGAWTVVANNANYSGATTAILNITKTTLTLPATGTKYKVVIINSCGTVTSNIVSITDFTVLSKAAAITVVGTLSPLLTTCQGTSVNLSLAAGSVGNIQWQSSTDGITYANVGESIAQSVLWATNLAMPFNTGILTQTTWFRVVASNGICNAANGTAIKITVSSPVTTGSINGGDVTVCAPLTTGFDTSGTALTAAITNSTTLTLSDYTVGATILWQKSTNYVNSTGATPVWAAAGSTTNTLTASALTVNTWYRVQLTNGACKDFTVPVKITVTPSAKVGVITSDASVCTGGNIRFTSAAYTGTSIQWEVSTTSATGGFTAVSGENGFVFDMNNVTYAPLSKFYVRNVVTSGNCTLARSAVKTIIVNPLSVPGTVKGGGTICSSSNATLSVAGNTGTIQWQYSLDGVEFKTVPYWKTVAAVPTFFNPDNATSFSTAVSTGIAATYIATNITADTYFRAKITSGACSVAYSNAVQYTIGTAAVAGTLTAVNEIVCKGAGTTLTLTGSVGSIKWLKSTNYTATSPTWSAVTTSTTGTLTTGILSVATAYKAEVTIGTCPNGIATSEVIPVMVYAAPLAKTITANVTSPSGASSALAICNTSSTSKVLTIGGGSIGAIQWQKSTTSTTLGFADITDATGTSYTITNPTVGANYFRAKFTNSCGVSVFGTAFTVHYRECAPTKAITSSEFAKTPFAVVAFPNPYYNNFNLDLTTSSSEKVEVVVYDMIGRLLEKHQENVSEINTLEIGTSYPAGVYNVIVTQGMEVKTVRVIKK